MRLMQAHARATRCKWGEPVALCLLPLPLPLPPPPLPLPPSVPLPTSIPRMGAARLVIPGPELRHLPLQLLRHPDELFRGGGHLLRRRGGTLRELVHVFHGLGHLLRVRGLLFRGGRYALAHFTHVRKRPGQLEYRQPPVAPWILTGPRSFPSPSGRHPGSVPWPSVIPWPSSRPGSRSSRFL